MSQTKKMLRSAFGRNWIFAVFDRKDFLFKNIEKLVLWILCQLQLPYDKVMGHFDYLGMNNLLHNIHNQSIHISHDISNLQIYISSKSDVLFYLNLNMYDSTKVNRPLHNSTHQNIRWVAFVTLIISFNRLLMTLFIVCNWRIMSNIVIFNLSSIAWQINITVNNERFMKSLTLGINECFHDAFPSCVYTWAK